MRTGRLFLLQEARLRLNEVDDNRADASIGSPPGPVLDGRFQVDVPPSVKLGSIHFVHLIHVAGIVGTTINHSDDNRIGVEGLTCNLATVGKLHDSLTDILRPSVSLIEEEDAGLIARNGEPLHARHVGHATEAVLFGDLRYTNDVTSVRHLGDTALDHGEDVIRSPLLGKAIAHEGGELIGKLVNNFRLSNAVTTVTHDRLPGPDDMGRDASELCECKSLHCHLS